MLANLILVFHVLVAATMIALVLVQHGKGADMGAAFGSGGSGSLFGASGSANFLSRSTGVLAAGADVPGICAAPEAAKAGMAGAVTAVPSSTLELVRGCALPK